jgi:class 3 adenylate cyclase
LLPVQLPEGQPVRDQAAQHLGEPDPWAEILRMDGLKVGARRRATVLFCDIRGSTGFAGRLGPEAVMEVLNLYLCHQAEIVASARWAARTGWTTLCWAMR